MRMIAGGDTYNLQANMYPTRYRPSGCAGKSHLRRLESSEWLLAA